MPVLPGHGERRGLQLVDFQVSIPQERVVGFMDVVTDTEQTVMSPVPQQLVSLAVEVDQFSFQLHSTDVSLCHAVQDPSTVSLLTTERTQAQTTGR